MHDLYVHEAWWQSIILTLILGGGGAWLAGSAIARTWRGIHVAVLAAIPMAMAVRFVHFALFEETLLSPVPWVVETGMLLVLICVVVILKGVLASLIQYFATRRFAAFELSIGDRLLSAYLASPWVEHRRCRLVGEESCRPP